MHRPGADPDNMQPEDFMCDFCGRTWREGMAIVEGHRGSLICGDCLAAAYRAIVIGDAAAAPAGYTCSLCIETRAEPGWSNPDQPKDLPVASVCRRCTKQSAAVLAKDKDYGWVKPVA
jgi:hypothetical protein